MEYQFQFANQVFYGIESKKDGLFERRSIESQPMVEFDFKAYRRPFAKTFATSSDAMSKRPGVLIRLRDSDGRLGFGEAAPIESFGTESFVGCVAACSEMKGNIEYEDVRPTLSALPCLRFGMESALAMMVDSPEPPREIEKPWPVCGLNSDLSDLESVERRLEMGYRGLKFKIGKESFDRERRGFDAVFDRLGEGIGLRLDANGGLSLLEARRWLEFLTDTPVEYLEQPLPRGQEETMRALAMDFPTAIALDESVVSAEDLYRWRDAHWPGLYVIKPSLAGGRAELIDALREGESGSIVFSSALETLVGTAAALSVAIEVGDRDRMLGFGVECLFADQNAGLVIGPFLQPCGMPRMQDFEDLWNSI